MENLNHLDSVSPARKLKTFANNLSNLTEEIDELESRLKSLKHLRQIITHKDMPDLMNEMGIDMISVNGMKFTKDLYFSGSWPKDKVLEDLAMIHLKELDALDIVKTELVAKFGRNEIDMAKYCIEQIESFCDDIDLKVRVHPMTLKSFVRKRLKNNEDIDPESLGIFTSSYVKVKK